MAERKTTTGTVQTTNASGEYVSERQGTTSVGQELTDAELAASKAAEKYNPVLRSKEKSGTEIGGGLGAMAAAIVAKQKAEAAKKKKAATTGTQAEALEKQ